MHVCKFHLVSLLKAGRQLRSLATYQVKKLQCIKYCEPVTDALELIADQLSVDEPLSSDNVVMRLLGSSINPADINVLQGKYGHLPKTLPQVVGNEGLFEVIKSNCSGNEFRIGDWAVVKSVGTGTWCTHLVAHKSQLIRMDKTLGLNAAATMLVNPVTAYLLLHSFVKLSEGENVLVNAPTSTVPN